MHTRRRPVASWRRAALWAAIVVAPSVHCKCANAERRKAYEAVVERETDAYVHAGDVKAELGTYLSGAGFVIPPDWNTTLTTDWLAPSADFRRRVVATLDGRGGGTHVTLTVAEQSKSPQKWKQASLDRREDLEAKLAETLGPPPFEKPATEVWEQIEELGRGDLGMFQGFDPPIDAPATTFWHDEKDGDTPVRRRLEARMSKEGKAYSVVIHERVERGIGDRTWEDGRSQRDREFELGFIEYRDPSKGAAIRKAATDAGQKAFDEAVEDGAWVAYGCGC